MEWNSPKRNTVVQKRIFSWLPRECVDGKTRLFCYLWIKQYYRTDRFGDSWKELDKASIVKFSENELNFLGDVLKMPPKHPTVGR